MSGHVMIYLSGEVKLVHRSVMLVCDLCWFGLFCLSLEAAKKSSHDSPIEKVRQSRSSSWRNQWPRTDDSRYFEKTKVSYSCLCELIWWCETCREKIWGMYFSNTMETFFVVLVLSLLVLVVKFNSFCDGRSYWPSDCESGTVQLEQSRRLPYLFQQIWNYYLVCWQTIYNECTGLTRTLRTDSGSCTVRCCD